MARSINYLKYFTVSFILILLSCQPQPSDNNLQDNLVIYPPPPAKTRIQYLTSFSKSTDFAGKQSGINRFLMGEEEIIPIIKPYGVSISNSKIYICDTGAHGLIIMNLENGEFYRFIPSGRGQLQLPLNCDTDQEGKLYIADGNRQQVVIFDKYLKYIGEFSLSENGRPTDIKVVGDRIIVSAANLHSLQVYSKDDYSFISSISGSDISDPSYLYQPLNFEAANNKIYISDLGSCMVKVFTEDGKLVSSFGSPGDGPGQFTRPKGIGCDSTGNIYVVDAAFENTQIFNQSGQLLMHFGGTYTGPGGMYLPADITIDYGNLDYFSKYLDPAFRLEYLIYVTNQYGPDKLSVYGFVGNTE